MRKRTREPADDVAQTPPRVAVIDLGHMMPPSQSSSAGRGESDRPPAAPPVDRVTPNGWRDPWAWLAILAVIPLIIHAWGAPLGEPCMDDFDYLHRALFGPRGSFFDGYGSVLYWRPLGRQVYFGLLAPLILTYPVVVPLVHGACLALTGLLLYRAVRLRWSGSVAAAMATFILSMESTRMLLAWPSHFMDLGAILFAALALHEAARQRWVTALAALFGSLLAKEIGLTTALLLPWMPAVSAPGGWRSRRGPSVATAGVLIGWGAVYLAACLAHGMTLPHQFEPATTATPWLSRYAWSSWNSVRAAFSLGAAPGPWDGIILIGLAVLVLAAGARIAAHQAARARFAEALPWIAWGLAWFLAASAALTEVYPAWAPYRAIFAGVGFGIAMTAAMAAASPVLVAGLVALRLFAFAVSAGPPATITVATAETGAAFDFTQLVRLQRMVTETRDVLRARYPTLPRGGRVGMLHPPIMTAYGFGASRALQCWYRDTTLRWVFEEGIRHSPDPPLDAVVLYEPGRRPQMMLIEPAALGHFLRAGIELDGRRLESAMAELAAAEAAEPDTSAITFQGRIMGRRAFCLLLQESPDWLAVRRAASRAMVLWPDGGDGRYCFAAALAHDGDYGAALAQLDTLLLKHPSDESAQVLREFCRAEAESAAVR